MMLIYLSYFLMILAGIYIYVAKYKHLLLMLLSLEFLVLALFGMVFMNYINFLGDGFILMIYLTMSVCEGALGLSLLVYLIRNYGNDMILTFDNLW
uniref:NADH-ubiquinone oxidoreductase chain 4L n=1 Tax=Curculionoidea sp. 22 KM-2017 TaxID=2219406 RepID=A0A346RIT0_9CUCU|nr:NADH dehydrogenase subunit 4L [Curculionoidea sp. 22 KM-2017]